MSRKLFLSNFPQKIREQIKNSQYHEVTIMRHPTETYTPDKTWHDLNQPHIFQPFFAGYLDLLRKKLSQVRGKRYYQLQLLLLWSGPLPTKP